MARKSSDDRLFEVDAARKPVLFGQLEKRTWTDRKAEIIAAYLRSFEHVTHHGVYIDGFAGMQNHPGNWAAAKVLEIEPDWLGPFYLIDSNPRQARGLRELAARHPGRDVKVIPGNCNRVIPMLLEQGIVGPTKAAFALLDQRTFECHWATVETIARHPKERFKIEQFYFFANGWLDRSLEKVSDKRALAWWGNGEWRFLRQVSSWDRATIMATRFKRELGYEFATPFAIYEKGDEGRIPFFMIHATDHRRGVELMRDAYYGEIKPAIETLPLFDLKGISSQ